MSITAGNLFADLPSALASEQVTALLATPHVTIERIGALVEHDLPALLSAATQRRPDA